MKKLHLWQVQARGLVAGKLKASEQIVLIEAGIGSGKTIAALMSAKDAIESRQIARVIVVTFTSHLVRQWGAVASVVGLNLWECRVGNGSIKDGFPVDSHGYVVTFASVASMPDLHEAHATGLRTLVIIDEIHHLGEEHQEDRSDTVLTEWAKHNYAAFKNANMVVALSGTPYRTDKKRIPFVQYDPHPNDDGLYRLQSDITYTYGQSVADGICRRVLFETLDGPIDMNVLLRNKLTGVETTHPRIVKFADKIEADKYYERLLAAVTSDSEYTPAKSKNQLLIGLMRKAINKLNDLRLTDPRAGGLIVTGTKDAARRLKILIKQMTGHDAILVLEDVDKASDLIDAFRAGDSPWIIAVNMVTEGVDIPRLRVCLYLSIKTAWLYVMQVIGRIVRDPPGQSYFFCFPDPRLMKIIEKIEKELEFVLRNKYKAPPPPPSAFEKIVKLNNATGDVWAGMIAGEAVTDEEMQAVEMWRKAMPGLDDVDFLLLLQLVRKNKASRQERQEQNTKQSEQRTSQPADEDIPFENGMSYTDIRLSLRGRIQKRVGELHTLDPQRAANDIHTALNREVGVRGKDAASTEQLEHMLALAEEWIATVRSNIAVKEFEALQ